MNGKSYDAKEVILTILREEQERQTEINKLKRELHEIERQGDMRDTKRITEIIDELSIIDPPPTNVEDREVIVTAKESGKAMIKKRRFMPLKISAVCIAVLLSVQAVSVTSSNGNFFDDVYYWGKDMIVYIMGKEIKEDNFEVSGSKIRNYTDIKTFQSQENLYVYIPESIDNNAVTEISYSFENKKSLFVTYENDYTLKIDFHRTQKFNPAEDNRTLYIHNNTEYLINMNDSTISWVLNKNLYRLKCSLTSNLYKEIITSIK